MIYSSKQVARELGISYWRFRGRIEKHGLKPHLQAGGVHFWDDLQVAHMQEILTKENGDGRQND